jgi:transposase-like protein
MVRCEEQSAVLIVLDEEDAERHLAAASISCPSCTSGRLRPWGYARTRFLRCLGGVRRSVRPRRARCRDCAATHVLLPADVLARHADTVEVVITALLAHQAGAGHRRIAADLDVSVDTVRSWLRRVTARAEWLRKRATVSAYELDAMLPPIEPTGSALGDALAALGVAAAARRRRIGGTASPWQLIGLASGGRLLAPVSPALSG